MRCCLSAIDLRSNFFVWPTAKVAILALAVTVTSPRLVFSQRYYNDVDPAAPPVTYHGLVINSGGKPVPNVEVISEAAWDQIPWGTELDHPAQYVVETSTRTDQNGHFELSGLRPIVRSQGRRTLYFGHSDYGLAWHQPYSEYGLTGRHNGQILIELQPGIGFDGVVTDLDGHPVAGATVAVSTSYSDNQNQQPRLATSYEGSIALSGENGRAVATDAAGHFRLPMLPVGAKPYLRIRHHDFAACGLSVAVDDRRAEIKLKPGVTVRGRLQADGKPIEQAGVEVVAVAHNRRGLAGRAKTDDQGRYELTGLDENEYAVLTAAFISSGKELVATPRLIEKQPPGANVSADLVCTAGQVVVGRLTDGEDQPAADHLVHGSLKEFSQSFFAMTDAEGRYRLRFAPGDYLLRTEDWKGHGFGGHARIRITREVSVSANSLPDEVDFKLEMVEIPSRLVNDHGVGVSGVFYWGLASQGGRPFPTTNDGVFWPYPVPSGPPGDMVYCAISRDKSLCRLINWSGVKEDFPEEIVLVPMARVVGRLADVDVEGLDAETFEVRTVPLRGQRRAGLVWNHVELPRDLWRLKFQPDGKFELFIPTGARLSLGFRTESGRSGARALFSIDDLKPNEVRDLGDVRH